jgi:glutamyl-tRNA reductase
MNLLALSINHHCAPVELREALFLGEEEIKSFVQKLKGNVFSEGLVISTCNRTEIYGIPLKPDFNHSEIKDFLLSNLPEGRNFPAAGPENFQTFSSKSALDHLFNVACGTDSLLIGDNQIFRQVKESFKISEEMQFAGFLMHRIFDAAIRTGKRAITETEISEGAVTVSFAAIQLIEKIFSNLNKKSALVIGAGETGEIAAKHLQEKNIGKLAITNRTVERAERLAEKLHSKIIPFANFKEYLHEYDIVISATSSHNLILTKDEINAAMKRRNYSAMVLMDIAVPRDIDPGSSEIDYVFYHDIDSLNIIVDQNLEKREHEIPKVKKVIEEEINEFYEWFNSLEAAPTIKNLRDHFEAIRLEEVEKNINKFSADDREKIDILTKRIINKILHNPTIELKNSNPDGKSENTILKLNIIRELFGIGNNSSKKEDS